MGTKGRIKKLEKKLGIRKRKKFSQARFLQIINDEGPPVTADEEIELEKLAKAIGISKT